MNNNTDFLTPDNASLATSVYGSKANAPIIFSHGGGQTRFAWGQSAQDLADKGWFSLTYDHRGHGDSGWSSDGIYNLTRFAEDQLALAKSFTQKPILVGASLGGLSAILAEGEMTTHGDSLYRAIVLVDITPKMNRQGALNIIKFMNENMSEGFASLDEAAEVIAEFTGRPKRKDVSGLEKNLKLRSGRYFWHWDPKFLTMMEGDQSGPNRLIDAAKAITCPILLIRGQQSDLVTKELAEEFLQQVPHATYVDVEEARHMVAGDKNDIFTQALLGFVEGLD